MTPDQHVFAILKESGIPGTKVAYQEGDAPPLPWFVYMRKRGGVTFAENSNYGALPRYEVELYQKENDPEIRQRLEDAIASIGPFTFYEEWIPTEQCICTTYSFTYPYDE